jgi:hypothetical protein
MNTTDLAFSAIGQIVIAGGGGAAITFLLIKSFGKSLLDDYFQKKAAKFKTEQDIALAELKRVHDAALKEVQAYIDKDLHRARKLYDREFEVLSEAWMLLVKAFDTTLTTIASFETRIDLLDDQERARLFEAGKFAHWQIDQVLAFEGQAMVDEYRKIKDQKRLFEYREHRLAFARYLAINVVFMPNGFKERFTAIDALVDAALLEFDDRINFPPASERDDAILKLIQDGRPLLNELEQLIHNRIWSAGAERAVQVDGSAA